MRYNLKVMRNSAILKALTFGHAKKFLSIRIVEANLAAQGCFLAVLGNLYVSHNTEANI